MGAKHFTELEVWQLADDLRAYIVDLVAAGPASQRFKFRDQICDAADSTCDNIAEGFGRYKHKEFANFLNIASGSLEEVESRLLGGQRKGFFSAEQVRMGRSKVGMYGGRCVG
jgi:four helix bundle protein